MKMLRLFTLLCLSPFFWADQAWGAVQRVLILKVDGLPEQILEQYVRGPGRTGHIAEVFGRNGAWLENFYTRGLSLSAPSWSLLDTGRHLEIHGNVEYDRYTLQPWDYLNFFSFYVSFSLKQRMDMAGVELLDEQGSRLLIDRFGYQQRYQSPQLLQRGVRWTTLQSSLEGEFTKRPLKELFDEWQTGFSMSDSVYKAAEGDILLDLKNPDVRYLDYYAMEFDHAAHLTSDQVVQTHVLDSLDALVGRLWNGIQSSSLADTTVMILVSDHGMNTTDRIVSQGYNLVDWFNSAAGGGHHVITDRHPMTEFKLKGLNPFVFEVITPSRQSSYLDGKSSDYPTVILDVDGNERANIGLRDSGINTLQILLQQLADKRVTGKLRVATIEAFLRTRDSAGWERELADLREELGVLHQRITAQEPKTTNKKYWWGKTNRDQGIDKEVMRREEQLDRWKTEERADTAYLETMNRLMALTAADFDPGKFKIEELIPRKSLGGLNSIHELQNYVTGLAPGGLVLAEDGSLDMSRSFRRIDYFSALQEITVRNNVQKGIASAPVDFIAVRVPGEQLRTALDDPKLEDGVWLWRGKDRQALVLTRKGPAGKQEIRYVPVTNLTQDITGQLHFERCEWSSGLPLELFEDAAIDLTGGVRTQWLNEWHDERDWLQMVHRSKYSNGVIGITEQLLTSTGDHPSGESPSQAEISAARRRNRLRTDLLVFANDHWNFNVRGFNPGGNHGSFLRASTHSVLLLAGGNQTSVPKGLKIDTPYDSLSLVPTILTLMEKAEPDLPGPVIEELVHK